MRPARSTHVLLRPAALAVQAIVLLAVVGGAVAYGALHKTVTLSVDGSSEQVSSFGRTVSAVLDGKGIVVGPHDVVAPEPDAALHDGDHIVVRYGRLLTLTVDGHRQEVWTTAQTVNEALDQVGLRLDGAVLSVSRSEPLGRAGLSVEARTPKHVTFLADGERHEVTSTALTLREAMAEAGVTMDADDTASLDLATEPTEGELVTITRITAKSSTEEQEIPFATTRKSTSELYVGQTKVEREGVVGVRRLLYADTWTDGKRTTHKLVRTVVSQKPVDKVVLVGTKAKPKPRPRPRPVASTSRSVSGASSLNWAALARCESGGNPKAYNPSGPYYGLYQFTASTWHSVGGSGIPTDASASEQTYRAQLLYQRSGAGQWPACGSRLYS